MRKSAQAYAEILLSKTDLRPKTAIVLGSGLGSFGESLENPTFVEYKALEDFPVSTAPGHKGRFIFGEVSGKAVVCMQGRLHLYEGYPIEDIVLPIRVLKCMGVENIIMTNAAGGINESFKVGDLMLFEDHINFMGQNPLIGPNDDSFGCRFPDMTFAYSPELRAIAEESAKALNIELRKGVFLACLGPSYETPAEIRAFRALGADAVAMSTVPEVIAANHCGMRVLAFSLISNMAAGILKQPLTEEEVIVAGEQKAEELKCLMQEIIKRI